MWLKQENTLLNLNAVQKAEWFEEKGELHLHWPGTNTQSILSGQEAETVWDALNQDVIEASEFVGVEPEIGELP